VLVDLPAGNRSLAEEVVELQDVRETENLRLDPSLYVPQINVLVLESRTPDGWPRFEIHSGDKLQAAAGLNWRGDHFAEVYVEADPAAVMRGHRAAVLSVIAGHLLGERKIALYRVENEDFAAKAEAQAILRQDNPKPMEA